MAVNKHIGYYMEERSVFFLFRVTLFGRVEDIKRNKYIKGEKIRDFEP